MHPVKRIICLIQDKVILMVESFIGEVALCSSCKQMKIIQSEETMNDEIL